MKKVILYVSVGFLAFSCGQSVEEVSEQTRIIKAEDRTDLISEEDQMLKQKGELFLNEQQQRDGVIKMESGLLYEVIAEGEGEKPTSNATVKVHYTGSFMDGKVFDSSLDRGEPIEFGLGQVIKGWTEGLQLMNKGAKYKFFIPHDLAYGAQGYPGAIPPYSALIFEVELLDFK